MLHTRGDYPKVGGIIVAGGRILGLDLVRAVGAWLVLLSHVAFWTGRSSSGVIGGLGARGELGVAAFFALSALLLSTPFVRTALGGATSWRPGTYFLRRAARILPGYLLALCGVLLAAAVIGGAAASALDLPTALAHLVIGQGLTGRTFQSFTQTWSLTTEVSFYMVLPLAALACAPLVRGRTPERAARRLLLVCVVVAVAGLVVQTLAPTLPDDRLSGVLATSALGHAAWFAIGVAITVVLEAERAGVTLSRTPALEALRTSPGTLLLLAAVLWLLASTPVAGPRGLADPGPGEALAAELLYGLVAACLVLAATSRGVSEWLAESPFAPGCRWLGDVSYAVFLWHVLVLQVAFAVLGLPLFAAPFWLTLLLVTVLSLGLGHLSWTLVERPLLTRAHRDRATAGRQPAPRA